MTRRTRSRSSRSSNISTPTIIMRLVGVSMRSHAVSTPEMRARFVMAESTPVSRRKDGGPEEAIRGGGRRDPEGEEGSRQRSQAAALRALQAGDRGRRLGREAGLHRLREPREIRGVGEAQGHERGGRDAGLREARRPRHPRVAQRFTLRAAFFAPRFAVPAAFFAPRFAVPAPRPALARAARAAVPVCARSICWTLELSSWT